MSLRPLLTPEQRQQCVDAILATYRGVVNYVTPTPVSENSMNPELREFLVAVRTMVNYIAKLTPTQYDDVIVKWIDYLLGDAPLPQGMQAQLSIPWDKLPWDQIIPLILPMLLQLLEAWLKAIGGGGTVPTPPPAPGVKFSSTPRC